MQCLYSSSLASSVFADEGELKRSRLSSNNRTEKEREREIEDGEGSKGRREVEKIDDWCGERSSGTCKLSNVHTHSVTALFIKNIQKEDLQSVFVFTFPLSVLNFHSVFLWEKKKDG